MSLSRAGFRSVVVAAGVRHECEARAPVPESPSAPVRASPETMARRIWRAAQGEDTPGVARAAAFGLWLVAYLWRDVLRVLPRLPHGSLYVVHEFSNYPAVWLMARWHGVPVLYDAHDFYCAIEPSETSSPLARRWVNPFRRWLERRCVGGARGLLTVSDGLACLLRDTFGREARVIRNCHDERLDRASAPGLRERLDLAAEDVVLVVVGNCKPGQVFAGIFGALAQLPARVKLVLVGRGYEAVVSEAASVGLAGRVMTTGPLSPLELVPSIQDADAALVLYYARSQNYRFALPNGLFQSVAARLPVIYSPLPEIAAVLGAAGIGLAAEPADATAVGQAVAAIIANRDAAGDASRRDRAAATLRWSAEERTFLAAVTDALQGTD